MTDAVKDGEDWSAQLERSAAAPPTKTDLQRARQKGRGRDADSPFDIPWLGWKDIGLRLLLSVPCNRLTTLAGGVAFFALLSIFPAIATIVSLYGMVANTATIVDHLNLLAGVLSTGVLDLIREQVLRVAGKSNETLGIVFAASLIVSLWSANAGTSALFDALNVVYGEKEKRKLLRLYTTTLGATLGSIVFVVAALMAIVGLPTVLRLLGFATSAGALVEYLRWPALLVIVAAVFTVLYRVGPSRRDAKWRWVTLGSAMAAVLWIGASMAFSLYVASFDSYNRLYSSLGAVVGFMTWFWLSIFVVLLGANLDAEIEHQTARDSTFGPPKPLGARGASMADHVGKSIEEL
jgi:membrane protein